MQIARSFLIGVQVNYWQAKNGDSRASTTVSGAMETMRAPLALLSSQELTLIAAIDEAEKISNALMSVWDAGDAGQPPVYPEARMSHLLHLLSNTITDFASQKLVSSTASHGFSTAQEAGGLARRDLWGMQSPADMVQAEGAVSDALTLLQAWRDRYVKQLMLDWMPGPQSISAHAWSGPAFEDSNLNAHMVRLGEVQQLLQLKRELMKALGPEDQHLVHDAFAGLSAAETFKVNLPMYSADGSRQTDATALTFLPKNFKVSAMH